MARKSLKRLAELHEQKHRLIHGPDLFNWDTFHNLMAIIDHETQLLGADLFWQQRAVNRMACGESISHTMVRPCWNADPEVEPSPFDPEVNAHEFREFVEQFDVVYVQREYHDQPNRWRYSDQEVL